MNGVPLPAFPLPARDESLSSWIERVGMFYGCDFEFWLGPVMALFGTGPSTRDIDVDSDPRFRDVFRQWTGLTEMRLPPILPSASSAVLPPLARLAFCPHCWDDDVAGGAPPYVRRAWSHWSCVHCPVHHKFLATRTASPWQYRNLISPWLPVWRSKRSWIEAFGWPPALDRPDSTLWHAPGRSSFWSAEQWQALSIQLERFIGVDSQASTGARPDGREQRVLSLAQSPALREVAKDISDVATSAGAQWAVRMTEDDLRRRFADCPDPPALLETRIGIVLVAAEIIRMLDRQEPISPDIARTICASEAARRTCGRPVTAGLDGWPTHERKVLLASF
jgi:hypothetical protein